ncbi:MAG TPA: hypothetical protein VME86_15540 [Acidobacteriaceae bacterium]|nr:hypothetical protein [Acidobacteriaceae bacterium]
MSRSSVVFLLKHVPQTNPLRLAQLRQAYIDLQCSKSDLREQAFPGGTNLLCTLPAASTFPNEATPTAAGSKTILFIANYRHEGAGQSVIDNWSGAIMLPFLYHALVAAPRAHTFLFADVEGEAGAKALFDSFSRLQRNNILGVVALDCLGLGPVQYYLSPFDSFNTPGRDWLIHQLQQAAIFQHLDTPPSAIPGGWFKIDVTREFRYHSIPSVLLDSVTWKDRNLPGSVRDVYASINPDAYYRTFSRLATYAVVLDNPWPSPTGELPPSPSPRRR